MLRVGIAGFGYFITGSWNMGAQSVACRLGCFALVFVGLWILGRFHAGVNC